MIITKDKEQLHYLKKIIKEKYRYIYRVRSDGMMEYDGMRATVLNEAKELCVLIKQEQKAEDDRIDCLCDALNKIMDIEMGIAMEYRVNVEDSEIYNTAHEAIQKTNPEYLTNPEYFITNKKWGANNK